MLSNTGEDPRVERVAKHAFSAEVKQAILRALKVDSDDLVDLLGFENFVFHRRSNNSILRITHSSHRVEGQIHGELEFIQHLLQSGAAVCSPIAFEDGRLTQIFDDFIVCQFERAPGRPMTNADWKGSMFQTLGKCIGEFHRCASTMPQPRYRRIDWRADKNLNFRNRIPSDQIEVLAQADKCLDSLSKLPISDEIYGLIHSDVHIGNFFVEGNRLIFFDFDDCCYNWFAFDIAAILFNVIMLPFIENNRAAQEAEASRFLPSFFEGYDKSFPVKTLVLEQLPLLLKAKELIMYGAIHAHMDVYNLDGWLATKMMVDRRRRIEAAEACLDLDFAKLLG